MAQLEIPFGIKIPNPLPVDKYYYNTSDQPYADTTEVTTQVVSAVRYIGQTFNVAGDEYWFKDGITDGDLVAKASGGGGGGGINAVVEDTTPQLGGNLDINGKSVNFATSSIKEETGVLKIEGDGIRIGPNGELIIGSILDFSNANSNFIIDQVGGVGDAYGFHLSTTDGINSLDIRIRPDGIEAPLKYQNGVTPAEDQDLATKKYVDDNIGVSGGDLNTWTPNPTPDNTVATSASVVTGYYTKVNNIITCSLYLNVTIDFTLGTVGSITIDVPIATSSCEAIGVGQLTNGSASPVNISVEGVSTQANIQLRNTLGLLSYSGRIMVTFQYQVN